MKTIYTFTFILFFALFHVTSSSAKHMKIVWQSGHIQFWNKTTLTGDVAYNWSAEMVSLRQADGRVHTYSANQVAEFGWFDYALSKQRSFVTLETPLDTERSSLVFFEVCLDGPLTVVRRLRKPKGIFKHLFSHPAHSSDQPVLAQNTDLFSYYVVDAGRLLGLDTFYRDIYGPLMTTYHEELRQYVATHNINDRALAGRLVLIDRYNFMVQHDPKSASNKSFSGVNE